MFKRKDDDIDLLSDTEGSMTTDTIEKNEPKMAATPAATPAATATTPAAAAPATAAATPAAGYTRPAETADSARMARPASFRPAGEAAARPATRPSTDYRPAGAVAPAPAADKAKASGRRVLTVGHDILLKGEIATCDRLVIEGAVDATLNEVHTVEIAETGSFKGGAEIEDAEISGEFDGELVVRNRLVIYGTGKVRGKITYGEIEIERGGELTGTIKTYKAGDTKNKKSTKAAKQEKEAA